MIRNLKRFWRWFRCDHRNGLVTIQFGDGNNLTTCRICGRAWHHTDGADPWRQLERAIAVTDGPKP